MGQNLFRIRQSVLARRFQLNLALVATLVSASQLGAGRPTTARHLETGAFKASTSRVWAAVTVESPIIYINQPINVTFAATNHVWRGKDFETLPLEFRVEANPF